MLATIGSAVPLKKTLATATITAPTIIWTVPPRAEATPAILPWFSSAMTIDDGSTRLALVVCDSCMIPREIIDEAKRRAGRATGIPVANMLVSATHTHTAPTATGLFQSDPDKDYQQLLTERIARGIEKAHANLAPARVGWGVEGYSRGVAKDPYAAGCRYRDRSMPAFRGASRLARHGDGRTERTGSSGLDLRRAV